MHVTNTTVARGVVFAMLLVIGGCLMYLPAARDDLTALGDDPFAQIIRRAYSDKVLPGSNAVGVSRLRLDELKKASNELLAGRQTEAMSDLFFASGGKCFAMIDRQMTCEIIKTWKLKNIGAPFDTSAWSDPAAKLIYHLSFAATQRLTALELDLVDVTVNKPIYTQ